MMVLRLARSPVAPLVAMAALGMAGLAEADATAPRDDPDHGGAVAECADTGGPDSAACGVS